jgi:diketogulonate reductase-like aldo/keto reductase
MTTVDATLRSIEIQGTTVPKASGHERRIENFEVFDFALSDEERERINGLHI